MNKLSLLSVILLSSLFGYGQITVTNTMTPQELVENILLGPGVVATNFSFNGVPADASVVQTRAGFFDANGTNFPINSGVVMSSGNVTNIPGNAIDFMSDVIGNGGDVDLDIIEPAGISDACVIEFDFVPSGDTISFQYMFASEEYPEFVNSGFNDAFGFFISGPGFAGPYSLGSVNIALLPDGVTPVTIDNVNDLTNSQFYTDNSADIFGTTTVFDGYTVVLTASASVQCGQTYHIKLALGDAGDESYDSAVFLAADSFSSDAVQVSVTTLTGDTTIIEGCTDANFIFSRPSSDTLDTLIINYDIGGTALEGTDFNNLINPVTFLPGEDTVILNVTAFSDGLIENPEFITITTYTISICGDTIVSEGILWITDPPSSIFAPSELEGCDPMEVIFTNNSLNGSSFEWIFGNGDTLFVNNMDDQVVTYSADAAITLVAYDDYNCSDTSTVNIVVNICGCTDPIAENYNPAANVDDGSCVYVYAEVVAPNVFTPNNDGDNDFYFLHLKNAVKVEMTVINRWGNVMFKDETDLTQTPQIGWSGTTNMGIPAEEGTYFYTYVVTGVTGDVLEGHGFFQLERD